MGGGEVRLTDPPGSYPVTRPTRKLLWRELIPVDAFWLLLVVADRYTALSAVGPSIVKQYARPLIVVKIYVFFSSENVEV